jgi:F-type H+-transporting ATPase subunit epsilon
MSPDAKPGFRLRVVTPGKLVVDAEAQEVSLPGLEGELGVLPGHRPLIAALGRGTLRYRSDGREERLSVRGGFADIGPERVRAFTELDEGE